MTDLYQEKGQNISRSKKALKEYQVWLLVPEKHFNRQHSFGSDYLDSLLLETLNNGEMSRILNNDKLENP